MNAFFRFFNNLPFLPKLLLLFFCGILLVALFKKAGGAVQGINGFVALLTLLWLIVILGALHAAGYLGPISRWPLIGPGLNWLTGSPIAGNSPPPPGHSLEECRRVAAEKMNALQGIASVFQELDKWRAGFRANRPGVVFWLAGPRGAGKSTLASALGCYFRGHGALADHKVYKFTWHDLQQHGLGRLNDLARDSLDGILVLDGADWLIDETAIGIQAGAALRNIAETHPQRLTVVVTCKTETPRRLGNEPQHKEKWLDYFTQHVIEFPALSDDTLLQLIRAMAQATATPMDVEDSDETTGTLRRWLREVRKREGESFANALTAQDIVEQIRQGSIGQPSPVRVDAERLRTIAATTLGLPL